MKRAKWALAPVERVMHSESFRLIGEDEKRAIKKHYARKLAGHLCAWSHVQQDVSTLGRLMKAAREYEEHLIDRFVESVKEGAATRGLTATRDEGT